MSSTHQPVLVCSNSRKTAININIRADPSLQQQPISAGTPTTRKANTLPPAPQTGGKTRRRVPAIITESKSRSRHTADNPAQTAKEPSRVAISQTARKSYQPRNIEVISRPIDSGEGGGGQEGRQDHVELCADEASTNVSRFPLRLPPSFSSSLVSFFYIK